MSGVTLKLATSLDGRIATASGESRWVTGPEAREAAHGLRAQHDAVLIGIGTALADDPELTVRLPNYQGRQPAHVVLDSRQRLPLASKLTLQARDIDTYVVAGHPPHSDLEACGVKVVQVPVLPDGRLDLARAVEALRDRGLKSLFVEGGGQVAASFLRAGLIDRVEWFRSPMLIGEEGRAAVGPLELGGLDQAPLFKRMDVLKAGADLWERYERL